MSRLSGTVVVTGAARGIGRSIAERLIEHGAYALLVDRDDRVRQVVTDLPHGRSGAVICDLDDFAASEHAIRTAVTARSEPLTGLVNNAGITRDALVERMDAQDFTDVIHINLGAAYHLTVGLSELIPEGGSVVSLSSRSYLGSVGQINYAASKGGIVGMTRALALELAPRVRVTAIAPGLVDTEMSAAIPSHILERLVDSIPFGRMGRTDEVASVVSWLLSPEAGYVTGQCMLVCGGRSLA